MLFRSQTVKTSAKKWHIMHMKTNLLVFPKTVRVPRLPRKKTMANIPKTKFNRECSPGSCRKESKEETRPPSKTTTRKFRGRRFRKGGKTSNLSIYQSSIETRKIAVSSIEESREL
jgi:hypothetical protein